MKDVKIWLDNPEYWYGVDLYEKYGSNSFLKEVFRSGKSPYNERKLKDELTALVQQKHDIKVLEKHDSDAVPADTNSFVLIRKREYELQQIYRAIDNNRFQLMRATTDKTRREYAFQILKLQQKKQVLYDEIQHIRECGCLPEVKVKPNRDFITPEIQRLYVQIYKAKKRLEQGGDKIRNKAKTENLLMEKISRLNFLLDERRKK